MSHPNLMIADCSDDFRLALEQTLKKTYTVFSFRDGKDAEAAALQIHPQFLILDLMLPGIDGITLLHNLQKAGMNPIVLAMTRFNNEYILEAAAELGVLYVIRKPCDPNAVAERLEDLSRHRSAKQPTIISPSECVIQLLHRLNISPRHRGYDYLHNGVLLMWKRPDISLTKELYPTVGEKYGSSYRQVERSMRSAIAAAWEQTDGAGWEDFSQKQPDGSHHRPSNGFLISRLAEELRKAVT